jgi:hypothetical protein
MKPLAYGIHKKPCQVRLQKVKSQKEAARLRKASEKELKPPFPLVPDGIVNFLLQNSPSAEVAYIDYETQKATS